MPKDVLALWEKGEHVFSDVEDRLMELTFGEKLGSIFSECTICPVGNGTCENFMMMECYGIHPDKPPKVRNVMVCLIGIKNIDTCPLSK